MDTNIYYIPEHKAVSITSNFAEEKKWMDLGVNPKIEYIPMTISDFSKYGIKGIGFTKVDNNYFQTIKGIFSDFNFNSVAFHNSTVDLSNVTIDVRELFIGDKSKIDISAKNFKNLKEVTFLSVKTFKGKVLSPLDSVEKAVLWDSTKASTLPEMFPNLKELTINKGGLTELDLINNKNLERLDIRLCSKLERILLPDNHKLNYVFIENCKNLDVSNLPVSVTSVWPVRKEKKDTSSISKNTTGDQDIDSLLHDLKDNMENYMKDANPYSQDDIEECIDLLSNHVKSVFKTNSKDEALKIVKSTILKLNALNDKCDGTLIETNEREQIAEIIILVGNKMGYNDVDEDVTEEWREW
ncbi:hypothetical protein [Chryseobacterium sp. ISL-6]|uniref:hypothetical protein n=1 Tax=Chryseobacterium sp. ISL-6 TaxID=2819143 RepID=UPI001BE67452|nr:hypothetical protein [Chryseobacterium sp. ISL-6]MBT2621908.1 hypothetical protein [Chryseobacterium sp. ISL-6]